MVQSNKKSGMQRIIHILFRAMAIPSVLFLFALVLMYARFADRSGLGGVPCLFHELTGLYCPGCGTTRAIGSVLAGDIAGAIGYNALALLTCPAIALALLAWAIGFAVTGRDLVISKLPIWLLWTILGVMYLFGILRNIPFFPFTLLAP